MIKPYIITMMDNDRSVEAAKRCVKSASQFGYYPELFSAITPENMPREIHAAGTCTYIILTESPCK